METAADNRSIIEIMDSQLTTQSENCKSREGEVPETESQGMNNEDDNVVVCPDDKVWTTGIPSVPYTRPSATRSEDEWG
jgi:hypothetical protein